ncbi:hypothetical protein ACLMJK_003827 [Lecanora helva]
MTQDSAVIEDDLDKDDEIVLQLHGAPLSDIDAKQHQLARDNAERLRGRRARTQLQVAHNKPIENVLARLSQWHSQAVTDLNCDIQDISSQQTALQQSLRGSDDQQSHLITKYALFDHRPNFWMSLKDYQVLYQSLQRRCDVLQTSIRGLTTARTGLGGIQKQLSGSQTRIDEQLISLGECVQSWRTDAIARIKRADDKLDIVKHRAMLEDGEGEARQLLKRRHHYETDGLRRQMTTEQHW